MPMLTFTETDTDGQPTHLIDVQMTGEQLAAFRQGRFVPAFFPAAPTDLFGPTRSGLPVVSHDVTDQPTYSQ